MTSDALELTGADLGPQRDVNWVFFKTARTVVTMQAFTIFKRVVEGDFPFRITEVIVVEMFQTSDFGVDVAEHCVGRMTGVAGFFAGDAGVLKMGGSDRIRAVDIETFSVGFHDVTRKTKFGRLRCFEVR